VSNVAVPKSQSKNNSSEAGSRSASKMNEFRGRLISALRQYDLTKTEWRVVVVLNDLYAPELGKAWPSQGYLSEALADVNTGRKMPIRTIYKGLKGLEQKGIIRATTVRISWTQSKLEYRIAYDKIIGRDAGYPKRRPRAVPVEGIQRLVLDVPAQTCNGTGTNVQGYWHKCAQVPAQTCHLSSLLPSLEPSIESSSVKDSTNFKEKEEGKGTFEVVESKPERSLRQYTERLAARKKKEVM
jgi:hypothetical protein